MKRTIDATYEVVTPLFCGGADPGSAELREPSFKGVLRFWWRALAWSRFAGDLSAIKRSEAWLFGSADGGQSRVLMKMTTKSPTRRLDVNEVIKLDAGARYLGYGLMAAFDTRGDPKRGKVARKAGQLSRACLEEKIEFTVSIRCRDLGEEEKPLLRALRVLGTCGGMGARSRRGYGSLVLRSLVVEGEPTWTPPDSAEALRSTIGELLGDCRSGVALAEYTAFAKGMRVIVVPATTATTTTRGILDLIGREMVRYRSWGKEGKILGHCESERNFKADHDLMKKPSRSRTRHPERIAFGLPHNCGKEGNVGPAARGLDRRASPFFVHIHRCGSTPMAVLMLLPSRFLPGDRPQISVGDKRVSCKPEADLYRPLHLFLDRFLGKAGSKPLKESFGEVMEVGL